MGAQAGNDSEDGSNEIPAEEQNGDESQEIIEETYSGVMTGEGVMVSEPGSLVELGYGLEEDGGRLLPMVAALHLVRRGVLQVTDDGKDVVFEDILNHGLRSDPSFFLKYLVYRDMRSRGRKIRAGLSDNPYLWFYEKPGKPCSHLVAIYSRNQNIPLSDLEEILITGGRYKKGVYLALVDEEGEVSYYEIKRFNTRPSMETVMDRTDVAQLVGPMTVVWNTEGAVSLYREGYFGKPIGIRKPRSMDFERPITLSYNESIYLAEKGRIKIEGGEGEVVSERLRELAAGERNFMERSLVYGMLKDSGFVVKSGMKFGVDFAVYEYGPGLDHAPFLIHVFRQGSGITPTEIVRAGRLAASVKKKFIVARTDCETGKIGMLSFSRVKP
jgi:tRNA-intron endonuclease